MWRRDASSAAGVVDPQTKAYIDSIYTRTLARVMNDAQPLSTLSYENWSDQGNLLHDSTVFGFAIKLSDELGRPLLATVPYDMTVQLVPVYTGRMSMGLQRPTSLAFPPDI